VGVRVKRLLVLVGLAVVLVGASACSHSTLGEPSAATTANGGGQTSSGGGGGETSTAPSGGATSLPTDPCSLLSSADLQQVGVSSLPTQDKIGSAASCEMDNSNDHIIVSLFPDSGLAGLQATGTVKNTTIGSHQAKQETDSTGSCVVAIGVSDTSSVDVTATPILGGDPCPTATTVARLVEPKLP
jgi:hypothetical protein